LFEIQHLLDYAYVSSKIYTEDGEMQHAFTEGLYQSNQEHDACGVGFVAHIKGQKSHWTTVARSARIN